MSSRFCLVVAITLSVMVIAPDSRLTPALSANAREANQAGQQPSTMQDMMKMHERMMAEMKAANAKLDQLVTKMNAATGDAKVNATADVVKELVAQHRAMCDRMGTMHQQMMSGHGMMHK